MFENFDLQSFLSQFQQDKEASASSTEKKNDPDQSLEPYFTLIGKVYDQALISIQDAQLSQQIVMALVNHQLRVALIETVAKALKGEL
jgi:hypothetical protein